MAFILLSIIVNATGNSLSYIAQVDFQQFETNFSYTELIITGPSGTTRLDGGEQRGRCRPRAEGRDGFYPLEA